MYNFNKFCQGLCHQSEEEEKHRANNDVKWFRKPKCVISKNEKEKKSKSKETKPNLKHVESGSLAESRKNDKQNVRIDLSPSLSSATLNFQASVLSKPNQQLSIGTNQP